MAFYKWALVGAAIAAGYAASTLPEGNLTVHEWGTFTSVAGPEGNPVAWLPLSGPPDLPCFVHRLGTPNPKFNMSSTVRMETPVIYFYSPAALAVNVQVQFPGGLITEWYPRAASVTPAVLDLGFQDGRISWDNLQVGGTDTAELPAGIGASRYYEARQTDALPVRSGQESEKLLFYRGAGNFAIPVAPRVLPDGKVELRSVGGERVPLAIVFENRAGEMGFRVVRDLERDATVDLPRAAGDQREVLRRELGRALEAAGLYPKEAQAMLATWGDSWFEEGMRVIYVMPRAAVDAVLPLAVKPAPRQTARVFVGRVEVFSPAMQQMLEAALSNGDTAALAKYGRFLRPFTDRIREEHGGRLHASAEATQFLQAQSAAAVKEFVEPSCVH